MSTTAKDLRKIIKDLPRYPGTKFFSPSPVIHKGFPSSFNLSFAEYEILNEFNDQYLDFDHDLIYSKIQPCIRHQDWGTILKDKKNRWRYLGLFDMADISGFIILKDGNKQQEANEFVIKAFVDFLEKIGLNKGKLSISYFKETIIKDATLNKYNLNKLFPTDPMLDYWKKLGIKDNQLVPDKTRDTLLSLKIFGKLTPWGYRNEIHYKYKEQLLDIGTIEFLPYHPVINDKNEVVDLKDNPHAISISAVGFERILMVINNLDNIWEIDTIKPLIDLILKEAEIKDEIQAMIAAQALRVIHRIVADGGAYRALNTRRKKYAREFYKALFSNLKELKIEQSELLIDQLLTLNANLNDWDKKLKGSVNQTTKEIQERRKTIEI